MFEATHYNDLPSHLRRAGTYPYLDNELNRYWLHAVDTAHTLLDKHRQLHGNATYYQDNFGDDFVSLLENDWIEQPVQVIREIELDLRLYGNDRKQDPSWQQYSAAVEQLKTSPRGTQVLVHMLSDDHAHWEARIHAGGGYISECGTMPRYKEKPSHEAAVSTLLHYEAYLARKCAEKDNEIIANYAKIRELGIHPGMELCKVEVSTFGKCCLMSFTVQQIYENGVLQLVNGRRRGSWKRYEMALAASLICPANIAHTRKANGSDAATTPLGI